MTMPLPDETAGAGPSTLTKRKPRGAHPSRPQQSRKKLAVPLPPRPTHGSSHPHSSTHPSRAVPSLPLKPVQGVKARRTDSTKVGWGREVVFVTRRTGLGTLIGRCRGLVVDEGYTSLRLHAMGAAIPQALLLLHAIMDVLPYPVGKRGMWYELRTGSTECVDEVEVGGKGKGRVVRSENGGEAVGMDVDGSGESEGRQGDDQGGDDGGEDDDLDLEGIGAIEEDEPDRIVRIKSSITIDLHISPRPSLENAGKPRQLGEEGREKKKARPNKRARGARARRREKEEGGDDGGGRGEGEVTGTLMGRAGAEEEEEEVEEVEER